MAEPRRSGHGALSDDDPSNVWQGLVSQTAPQLLFKDLIKRCHYKVCFPLSCIYLQYSFLNFVSLYIYKYMQKKISDILDLPSQALILSLVQEAPFVIFFS